MNSGEITIKNINEKLLKLFTELINNIKEKNFKKSIITLNTCKELIIKIIEEISFNKENNIKILQKELINQLLFFKEINSYIKESNILFQIKSILNDILINIFVEKNYLYICESSLFQDLINNCLNIIYLNSKSKLIFLLLIKKIDNFIEFINSAYPSYKEHILNIRNKFQNNHSNYFLNYKKEFEYKKIYNLSKSNELKDKQKSLSLLSNYFYNFENITEKYEFLYIISKELFPSLFDLKIPDLSHKKNNKNIELYINIGKFLLKFFITHDYIFDFSSFRETPDDVSERYPCLFFYNKKEINNLDELNNKKYKISYQYDILKEYSKEIIEIMVNYFIKPMIKYDTNFEIQFIIFKILKYLYFICENKTEKDKNKFINYIPEILDNLSFFKKQDEFNISSESREFGYYLLLKDSKFKCSIKSLTNSPKNENDIYTTKINMAQDSLNKIFFEKKEIERGKSFAIITQIYKKYSIIYIEFYIEDDKDITLTIYKKNEKENNYEQIGFNNIIKTEKNEKNKEDDYNDDIFDEKNYKIAKVIIINSLINNDNNDNFLNYANEFKIVFDNYDSWFTNKIIYYYISVFENNEI